MRYEEGALPDDELPLPFLYRYFVRDMLDAIPDEEKRGDYPGIFAKRMALDFMYGERRTYAEEDTGRPVGLYMLVRRGDLPDALKPGLGNFAAAVIRDGGVDLHESEALAELEWSRTRLDTNDDE